MAVDFHGLFAVVAILCLTVRGQELDAVEHPADSAALHQGLPQSAVGGDEELSLRGQLHDAGLHLSVLRLKLVEVGQHHTS